MTAKVTPRNFTRVVERYPNWTLTRERQQDLRLAGFHGQATDMGDEIHLIIDGGKRGKDLAQLPPRRKAGRR